ncbi:fimbrial biogenesis chaperone [Vibrio sp.]|uniref:fimbrial biogenesis chaperone n=1 Tax=Vibrio sp. TaxID=678 RepID=UPI003AA9CD23
MKTLSIITIIWCFFIQNAQAALALDRTRIIFPEKSKLETIRVKNPSNLPYLSQAWITNDEGTQIMEPFMVVPPLIRIESQDYALLRIEKTGMTQSLPLDRESLFYFHVREVPPKDQNKEQTNKKLVGDTGGSIQFAIESVIKMFYRPDQLSSIANIDLAISKGTKITKKDNQVWIENNSPFYATYFSITDNHKKKIKGLDSMMLKPYSRKKISLLIKGNYYITHINDYGALITNLYQCDNEMCQFSEKMKQE